MAEAPAGSGRRRRRALGVGLVVAWQVIGVNLYRLKCDITGECTPASSMLFAGTGVLLLVLRHWPASLVRPRQEAWRAFVVASIARGCPPWYKEHVSQTLAQWIDHSLSVLQNSLAVKLILVAVPSLLRSGRFFIPSIDGVLWLSQKGRIGIYHGVLGFTNQLVVVVAAILFGNMLLGLWHNLENVSVPGKDEATRDAAFPWKPIVWFIAARKSSKIRTSVMRLMLVDKVLACTIYCGMAVPVLHLLGLKIRTVLAVGGVGGLATGLALQNLVQNLISGILIYINSSVCEGLEVILQSEKVSGVVASVGWFNTVVNQYDGFRVVVPNRRIVDGVVVDKTRKCFRVAVEDIIVLMDDAPMLEQMVTAVHELLLSSPSVLQKSDIMLIRSKYKGHLKIYEPQFVLNGWSDYGAKFRLRAYFKATLSGDKFLAQKSELLLAVNTLIHEFGGKVGFPGVMTKHIGMSRGWPLPPQEEMSKETAAWRQAATVESMAVQVGIESAATR